MFSFDDENTTIALGKISDEVKKKFSQYFDKSSEEDHNLTYQSNNNVFFSIVLVDAWNRFSKIFLNKNHLSLRTKLSQEKLGEYLIDLNTLKNDTRYFLFCLLHHLWEYELHVSNVFNIRPLCLKPETLERLDSISDEDLGLEGNPYPFSYSFLNDGLSLAVITNILNSPELSQAKALAGNITNAQNKLRGETNDIISKADESINYFKNLEKSTNDLKEKLLDVKREGNFKLLARAFSSIRINKDKERASVRNVVWGFIILLFIIPAGIFLWHLTHSDKSIGWSDVIFYAPLLSLEILCLYFMRLHYSELKSIKSQLLQIDLRLNLCEFIHDYIETKEKVYNEKNGDSWKFFESLIFSPIQVVDDKIPSMLDGTEALAELAGKILKNR